MKLTAEIGEEYLALRCDGLKPAGEPGRSGELKFKTVTVGVEALAEEGRVLGEGNLGRAHVPVFSST